MSTFALPDCGGCGISGTFTIRCFQQNGSYTDHGSYSVTLATACDTTKSVPFPCPSGIGGGTYQLTCNECPKGNQDYGDPFSWSFSSDTAGCKEPISASKTPTSAAVTGFEITITGIEGQEGQRDGLDFLGTNAQQLIPAGVGSPSQEELIAARDEIRVRMDAILNILVDEVIERGIYDDIFIDDLSQWSGHVPLGHNAGVGVRYYPEGGGTTRVRLARIPIGYDAGFDELRTELGRVQSALDGREDSYFTGH